jgi:hypothetical protein
MSLIEDAIAARAKSAERRALAAGESEEQARERGRRAGESWRAAYDRAKAREQE